MVSIVQRKSDVRTLAGCQDSVTMNEIIKFNTASFNPDNNQLDTALVSSLFFLLPALLLHLEGALA